MMSAMTTQAEVRAQAAEVMQRKLQGWTVDRIAVELKVSDRTVRRRMEDYRASLAPDAIPDMRAVANARFDDLMSRAYLVMDTPGMKPETRLQAIGELRKLERERLQLFGAYMPTQVQIGSLEATAEDRELVAEMQDAIRAQMEARNWAITTPVDDPERT